MPITSPIKEYSPSTYTPAQIYEIDRCTAQRAEIGLKPLVQALTEAMTDYLNNQDTPSGYICRYGDGYRYIADLIRPSLRRLVVSDIDLLGFGSWEPLTDEDIPTCAAGLAATLADEWDCI